jgi:WD40 repeat protein
LTGHTSNALAVTFSPSGQILASIGSDNAIYLWNLDVNEAIKRVCDATHGVLTKALWQAEVPGLPYNPPCRAA